VPEKAADRARDFFVTLPPWIDELEKFLAACRTLATVYDQRDQDPSRGVVFYDPFDGAEVRWHHAQRGTIRVGHHEIEVHPFGEGTGADFVPVAIGTVDRSELARFIAPCLTHMLDAYLSSLVLRRLRDAGITDVIELRDAWCVPVTVAKDGEPDGEQGEGVLDEAIAEASDEWFRGLGGIYDRLIYYLGDHPTFGPFVRDIKARWQGRLAWGKPPYFVPGSTGR